MYVCAAICKTLATNSDFIDIFVQFNNWIFLSSIFFSLQLRLFYRKSLNNDCNLAPQIAC